MYTDLQLYIDGEWLNGKDRKREEVLNPATGKSLGSCRMRVRPISTPRWRRRQGLRCGGLCPPMTAPRYAQGRRPGARARTITSPR